MSQTKLSELSGNDRRGERNLCNCVKKPEKNSVSQEKVRRLAQLNLSE